MTEKILIYSQHLLGVGHFARSLKLAKKLSATFEVTLINGGSSPSCFHIPKEINYIPLPSISSDETFKNLYSPTGLGLAQVWKQRREVFENLKGPFNYLVVELFPFGRMAFTEEIIHLLELKSLRLETTKVICSLRDILVDPPSKMTQEILHRFFHCIWIHGDPKIFPQEFFNSQDDFFPNTKVPYFYTGFLVDDYISPKEEFIIGSIGGGAVGQELLKAITQSDLHHRTLIVGGPHFKGDVPNHKNVFFHPEVKDLYRTISCAMLSINMAGYNTLLESIFGRTFSLVYPLSLNQEQGTRAKIFEEMGYVKVLSQKDLRPSVMKSLIGKNYGKSIPRTLPFRICTEQILSDLLFTLNNGGAS